MLQEPNLISTQLFNFSLEEKKREETRSERLVESLKLGMELNCELVNSPTPTCTVLLVGGMVSMWRGAFAVSKNHHLRGVFSRSSAFYLGISEGHSSPALLVLLNVSKHLLSLWCLRKEGTGLTFWPFGGSPFKGQHPLFPSLVSSVLTVIFLTCSFCKKHQSRILKRTVCVQSEGSNVDRELEMATFFLKRRFMIYGVWLFGRK